MTQRVLQPLAVADQHQLIAVAGELLDVLGGLLQQGRRDIRRVPGRRELDHSPVLLAQDLEGVGAIRGRVDQLVRDERNSESALIDVHYCSRNAASWVVCAA